MLLSIVLVCGTAPASALADLSSSGQDDVSMGVVVSSSQEIPTRSSAEGEPASQESTDSTSSSESESSPEGDEVVSAQTDTLIIASFAGAVDDFTALSTIAITRDQKTTVDELNLPNSIWVILDANSLSTYMTDNADEYAASEVARAAHNNGTEVLNGAVDLYKDVTIPEGAIQVSVTDQRGRDTGTQIIPAYAEKTLGEVVVDNTISRTTLTNTYKQVVPTGVESSFQFPWWIIALLAALLAGVVGYGVHRRCRNRYIALH